MMQTGSKYTRLAILLSVMLISACSIKDDFPLPLRKTEIIAFEVEGQCNATDIGFAEAAIDREKRNIDVFVSDTVDITCLKVNFMQVSKNASIMPQDSSCIVSGKFPTHGIDKEGDSNVYIDFSSPRKFFLSTYQDYEWTINVHQVIEREVSLSGQVGDAIIDPINNNIIVYVSTAQSLFDIKVNKFSIGGRNGRVSPDPTQSDHWDFSRMTTFNVTYGWTHKSCVWRLFVYQTEAAIATTAKAEATAISATISGTIQNGNTPHISYTEETNPTWTDVPETDILLNGSSFTAELQRLTPETTYLYKVTGNGQEAEGRFTTSPSIPNGNFDNWHALPSSSGRDLWLPYGKDEEEFWDTGNHGATTVGSSNSTCGKEDGRTFANLQSKYIVIKFAAGNIFSGKYLKTDGTNGILGFGRPFTSKPTHLQFDYKYTTSIINRGGDKWDAAYGNYIQKNMYDNLRGQPDSCQIYIALLDDFENAEDKKLNTFDDEKIGDNITYPWLIRTRPSNLHLFNPNSRRVIGYAELTQGNTTPGWQTVTLDIKYRYTDRQPKYILIVASSSKYGDYFVGGDQSLLQLDNMKLLYKW